MQGNNVVMLIGRVGKDPETRTIASGKSVTKFSLAVNRPAKDAPSDWFQVELWGKQAELAADLIRKGALISVVGACHVDEWTAQDGNKQRSVKVAADGFQLLERRDADGPPAPQTGSRQREMGRTGSNDIDPDDVPPF
jgi:single-strand DNA-binding protein